MRMPPLDFDQIDPLTSLLTPVVRESVEPPPPAVDRVIILSPAPWRRSKRYRWDQKQLAWKEVL